MLGGLGSQLKLVSFEMGDSSIKIETGWVGFR